MANDGRKGGPLILIDHLDELRAETDENEEISPGEGVRRVHGILFIR